MKHQIVKPGDVVATQMGTYQHWSIVTDQYCQFGKPKLISATRRNKTVREEPWDVVVGDRKTIVAELYPKFPVPEILARARSHIDSWEYSALTGNCEHFVAFVTGHEVKSSQVRAGVVGATVGVGLVNSISENPTFLKLLAGAVLVGGIAVLASGAKEREY
ncbi:lecithin retinol acyltransferase family protein [Ruegeria arenilitoris]|uniref:lecithin retinol acyltransferase family protein n=1 Tax=Ruegeria arenilitoris TaxID=1173585 RepID=UPI00147D7C2D